eukprot:TRINITY_DN17969_c0_g1_i1.p1 TRINITY_DN17969_c0_g1~~TRINITY_DN17969_c0_g1_i1.p1  ORF type:complete len:472 (+),score=81.28 TRINITY_DN17969_c0_g1_i1:84-1499(+)
MQTSLSSFFATPNKKQKTDPKSEEEDPSLGLVSSTNTSSPTDLTPEQLARIELNRKKALTQLELRQKQAELNNLTCHLTDPSWRSALEPEFQKSYFSSLYQFLQQEKKAGHSIFPPEPLIFNAFNLCPYDKVKIVILGQDPYHAKGQAHGLAFSVQNGISPPPSLRNIFKELREDLSDFSTPSHGSLENWAKEGVLLLNTCLTVRESSANSHAKKGWEEFTDAAIKKLNERSGLVFLLWGRPAQEKTKHLTNKANKILKSAHPSPLSAANGFFGCKHFSKANQILEAAGKTSVDWSAISKENNTPSKPTKKRPIEEPVSIQTSTSSSDDLGDLMIEEVKGDLMVSHESLAHCVSEDMVMGKGIAIAFKENFGGVQELKSQKKKVGEVAFLKRGERYIYYLVTKQRYSQKPSYDDLQTTLSSLRTECLKHGVTHLCMPRIGCGLDGMEWSHVKRILVDAFRGSNVRLTIFVL